MSPWLVVAEPARQLAPRDPRVSLVSMALVAATLCVPLPFSSLFVALPLATAALWQCGSGWSSAWPRGGPEIATAALALAAGAATQGVLIVAIGGGAMADWIGIEKLPPLHVQPDALWTALANAWMGNAVAYGLVFHGFFQSGLASRGYRRLALLAPPLLCGLGAAGLGAEGVAASIAAFGLALLYQTSGDLLVPILFRGAFDTVLLLWSLVD